MNPVVLVGRRGDNGRRDQLWNRCQKWWETQVGWPVVVGYHNGDGPFCLAVASNNAAKAAGDWDVCLYSGADVLLGSPEQARQAVALAVERQQLVFAHDHYYALTEEGTEKVLSGEEPHGDLSDGHVWTNTFSSALAIPRTLWNQVKGFDERFVGWGWEDLALWSACCAIGGGYERVTGPVFHLYHERDHAQREGNPHHARSEALGRRYMNARTSRIRMLSILKER